MENVFEKRSNCLYCKKEMVAKYRNKKFCSDMCRVYFGRENKIVEVKDLNTPTNKTETKKPLGSPKTNFTIDTTPKKTPLDTEPMEGTTRFFLKYGAFTHEEAKKLNQ